METSWNFQDKFSKNLRKIMWKLQTVYAKNVISSKKKNKQKRIWICDMWTSVSGIFMLIPTLPLVFNFEFFMLPNSEFFQQLLFFFLPIFQLKNFNNWFSKSFHFKGKFGKLWIIITSFWSQMKTYGWCYLILQGNMKRPRSIFWL